MSLRRGLAPVHSVHTLEHPWENFVSRSRARNMYAACRASQYQNFSGMPERSKYDVACCFPIPWYSSAFPSAFGSYIDVVAGRMYFDLKTVDTGLFQNSLPASVWNLATSCSSTRQFVSVHTYSMDSQLSFVVFVACRLTNGRFVFDSFPLKAATSMSVKCVPTASGRGPSKLAPSTSDAHVHLVVED